MKRLCVVLCCTLLLANSYLNAQTGWQTITGFGTNPGNLNMHSYIPTGITGKAPLVLAMHGCGQDAVVFASQSGWDKLADEHLFYVVYPEQNVANNADNCFNWFVPEDMNRGQGEPLSIQQMVAYMEAHYDIDTTKIFVTGLSAGACMTNVMLACYPDVFSAGATMSGVPYKAATTIAQSDSVLLGLITRSPQAWGDSVRSAYPTYTGPYPRVAIFQGTSDEVSNEQNSVEDMKQWTNVDNASQTPVAVITPFNGNSVVTESIYDDTTGTPVVETFFITGMPHGIALDTGSCYWQCGETGPYAIEVDLSSSFWAAYFWGITGNDGITINGLQVIDTSQNPVTYSVTNTSGVTYNWTVPQGATIISGQGTNQIMVNFSIYSGNITVVESSPGQCKEGPANLFVNVFDTATIHTTTGIVGLNDSALIKIFPNPSNGNFFVQTNLNEIQTMQLFDLTGKLVLRQIVNGSASIDAGNLSNGIYLLNLKGSGININQKIIVSR